MHLDLRTGRVTAIGRLDGRSAALLHDAVSVLLGTEQPTLTVDVSGMEVADHAALRAIGDAYRRAMRQGRRITLRGASPQLRSALTRLHLGPGQDAVMVNDDQQHDLIDCGPGQDVAEWVTTLDPTDQYVNCEVIQEYLGP